MAEDWRPFPRNPRYLVSSRGRILGPAGKVLKPGRDSSGYFTYSLAFEEKAISIRGHVLVLETFTGPRPEGKNVVGNHKDQNRQNNEHSNLEWTTQKKNIQQSVKQGSHRSNRKMSPILVRMIRNIWANSGGTITKTALAKKVGIPLSTLRAVINNPNYWKNT